MTAIKNSESHLAVEPFFSPEAAVMHDYAEWIAAQRRDAIACGGKPLRKHSQRSGADLVPFARTEDRKPGEIVNPVTGEIVTGCLTVSKLADRLGVSPQQVTALMEKAGAVVRVLRAKEVPMICAPELTKPRYEHTPEVTRDGVDDGLVIPLMFKHGGRQSQCILITPRGQEVVKAALQAKQSVPVKSGKVESKARRISELLDVGLSQAAIVRATSFSQQTVSRIMKTLPTR
ncbi:hypothetical protein [uncultured Agrobacterium sp.]|uniref:hypothetical protein n=1 Tax=uncultured Agrobacterium sp. TaxID=157277 RepID=UPI0025E621FD|nr:hypothetical protein [uncultured Agrobacterium sp.]